jgi:hypothetical protein
LREEHKIQVLENNVHRKIFGFNKDEVNGKFRVSLIYNHIKLIMQGNRGGYDI